MKSRLLIVEDDPEINSALTRGLALHGYDAVAVNRADLALDRLVAGGFAGAIVDVMLGADSGIELVRRARAQGATLPILMLSALSDVEHRAAGLEAGADDYVVKPFSFDELVARLRVQQQRAPAKRPDPARLDPAARTLTTGATRITLTEREYALLAHLAAHADTPLPRAALLEACWSAEAPGTDNVVDVYIGYLRKKLAGQDFHFQIDTVRNKGFCLTGQAPVVDAQ